MARKIFVNLPIADMQRSRAFFEALGFAFNPQFTNEQGACMVISEDIYAMLLVRPFFQTFTDKRIADARESAQVLLCLSCDSRGEVDALMARALAAGATEPRPAQDHGFMYYRAFDDLDGHGWELMHMDMAAAPGTPPAAA
ncbi:VOC family protein [Pulveribacter sp.]|uniref:VOC family protein n=1 Tax=Pulveribacter sp. TaxID=2678893 RepID=UPI0028AAD92D|nr:VOC family protein [Pulveribacter sp.]